MLYIVYCLVPTYFMSFFDKFELKWFITWWLMGWAWVSLIWYLSLTATPLEVDLGLAFSDKVGHFIAYGWLMFWFGNLYRGLRVRLFYAGLFILMGIGLEVLQGMGQVRQFEYYDMFANSIGVIIGFVLVLTPLAKGLVWTEGFFKSIYD